MRERAIFTILKSLQIPDDSGEQDDWRLDEEVSLLLQPRAVQVHHDGICRLVSVGNIRHEIGMNRIAAVRVFRVIEVDEAEPRRVLAIFIHVVQHVIVCNHR